MKKINVLLATYNGSKYISELINSVLANFEYLDEYDCNIIISDDASTDNTVSIIESICKIDTRVTLLDSNRKGGVKSNFQYLILNTEADYIFFCDQDDLWLPMKMKIFMDNFSQLEDEGETNILLHSDLCVADMYLSPIHISMFQYQKINPNPTFLKLLISSSVTGCVMAVSKGLLNIAKSSNIKESIMHDWYMSLIASTHGVIKFIPKPLILYRQHDNNQVGAKSFSLYHILKLSSFKLKLRDSISSVNKTKRQAIVFRDDFHVSILSTDLNILNSYIDSFNRSSFRRLYLFMFSNFKKKGLARNFIFLLVYAFLISKRGE
ncbi:glycosyltransferase family 2 protein [Rahnella aceris]|uniref:glycosyltransferase family 2 protein n=1 Tax=Rahnella sp. (strain Y9602) TaxID=2703885 RepID=UPI001906A5EB|nr:glycosyltransferase family 2 protein [Rahnella aceris]QQN33234.1 glycosyltransferase family 2 protein [Rahnella aceris]